jgi:hypothetical protein
MVRQLASPLEGECQTACPRIYFSIMGWEDAPWAVPVTTSHGVAFGQVPSA